MFKDRIHILDDKKLSILSNTKVGIPIPITYENGTLTIDNKSITTKEELAEYYPEYYGKEGKGYGSSDSLSDYIDGIKEILGK
jgi:hypothetical protein